jgi:uncharacterized membrane protein YfcA
MDVWGIVLVCAAGFVANGFGIITGGSGLVTTALMIALGVPPAGAVAITRFSVLGVDIPSIGEFHRAGKIHYRLALPLAAVSAAAAAAGAQTLTLFDAATLKAVIGGAMLASVVLLIAFPKVGTSGGTLRSGAGVWALGASLIAVSTAVAAVTGGLAGTLYSYILVGVFGETFLESAGTRKVIAFALTIFATATFVAQGLVDFTVGVPLLLAGGLGGWLGSRTVIRRGEKAARWIFLAGAIILAVWVVVS